MGRITMVSYINLVLLPPTHTSPLVWGGGGKFAPHDPELSSWIPMRPWPAEVGLILVKEALYKMGVPVAYMQLDDWWCVRHVFHTMVVFTWTNNFSVGIKGPSTSEMSSLFEIGTHPIHRGCSRMAFRHSQTSSVCRCNCTLPFGQTIFKRSIGRPSPSRSKAQSSLFPTTRMPFSQIFSIWASQ